MRVCILGTGLTSLTLTKALVNEKIYVDVFHSKNFQKINHSRTIGISKKNINFFNKHIININKFIWKLKKIHIYSDNLKKEKLINFQDDKDQLFSIIKNFQLYELLKKSLRKNKYYKEFKFKEYSKYFDKYNIIINTDHLNPITKKFFNKKIVKKYNSLAYTCILDHQSISNDFATQIFTKKGPLAFLPISNKKTSVVYSIKNIKKKDDRIITDLINKYNLKYKIDRINKIESFQLNAINLRSYYHKKYLAFGDLLHRIHPLAGQGFNMILRDIEIFLKIIKKKRELGLPLDYSVNAEFEKITKHKNFIFSKGIDLIYEFFNFESKLKNNSLSKSIQFIGKNATLNKFFTNIADKSF